jgi:pyruvate/2-oxoglutarate dehydrogenase complex dihydrolipoamide acyltransferase (E2) component
MDYVGKYEKKLFSKNRQNITLITNESHRKHSVHALIEVDVTKALEIIRENKNEKGRDISFTGWLIKCIAQAISEHRVLNTYRLGKRKTVVFEDVDIPIPVERNYGSDHRLLAYIIRKANEKSVDEITNEIRNIQKEDLNESTQVLGKNLSGFERFILNLPLFLKKFALLLVRNNGIFKKKHIGTVGVTAIGMKGKFPGWAIPLGGINSTLIVAGGIRKKPGVVNDKIEIRDYLHLTVTVDHDLVDGGPLVRFVERLTELIENTYGLSN